MPCPRSREHDWQTSARSSAQIAEKEDKKNPAPGWLCFGSRVCLFRTSGMLGIYLQ